MRVYTGKVLGAFLGFVTLGVVGGLVGFLWVTCSTQAWFARSG